jgi:SPP1 gp7 family putative phage head morphogenesis protein
MAKYFAKSSASRSDAAMRSILKRGGWTVRFKMTAAMRDVMNATIAENVGLIKSIPEQYHTEVQGLVMRSATAGRDLSTLSDELERRYAITRKRAELVARDQTNKMTANFTRVRQTELGITEAIWLHSGGGKTPRRSHLAKNGKRYDVATGWYDPDVKQYIWPGTLINCRCVSKPIVRGFS